MKKAKVLLSVLACAVGMTAATSAVSAMPLKSGSQSVDVLDLQERLAALGYFNTGVTGYYGALTAQAVRKFQEDYQLPADGEADSATLAKLMMQKAKPNQIALEQLARIIYSEARGESFDGQVAIGAVVLNRVQSSAFPDSIGDVIFQTGQFTAVDNGQYWLSPNESAYRAAREALNGTDPTKGALFYYNPKIATSYWSASRPMITKIGNHVFTQ